MHGWERQTTGQRLPDRAGQAAGHAWIRGTWPYWVGVGGQERLPRGGAPVLTGRPARNWPGKESRKAVTLRAGNSLASNLGCQVQALEGRRP